MRLLRTAYRLLTLVVLLAAASIDCLIRRPRVGAGGAIWIHRWSRRIVEQLGVKYTVRGNLPESGAVVSNHLSYLDILIYSAIRPFIMVAKTEVRGWPLFGWLTAQAGTVYVQRGGGPTTHAAVNAAMAEAYRSGLPVLFFPEGTTTDGAGGVLPFRRGLFHSVLNEGVALRTSAIRYDLAGAHGSVAEDICWWGDMSLAPHLLRLLGLSGVSVTVRFAGEVTARADRFALSESACTQVAEMYGHGQNTTQPAETHERITGLLASL